jgi:hypothetical protein
MLISNKADFKSKLIRRDKDAHFILIKGTKNSPGGHNNCKHRCTKHQCNQFCKANTGHKTHIDPTQ